LPDAPSPDQLDAWLELAALAGDEDFQRTTTANATWYWEQLRPDYRGSAHAWEVQTSPLIQAAAAAREAGRAPSGDEGRALAGAYAAACAVAFGRDDGPAFRAWLLEQIDAHTDPRAGRYWELVGKLRGAADRKDPVPQAPATAPDAAGVADLCAADHAATSSGDPASLSPRHAAAAHAWLVEALRSKVQMERAT